MMSKWRRHFSKLKCSFVRRSDSSNEKSLGLCKMKFQFSNRFIDYIYSTRNHIHKKIKIKSIPTSMIQNHNINTIDLLNGVQTWVKTHYHIFWNRNGKSTQKTRNQSRISIVSLLISMAFTGMHGEITQKQPHKWKNISKSTRSMEDFIQETFQRFLAFERLF